MTFSRYRDLDRWLCSFFGKRGSDVLVSYSLYGAEASLSYWASRVCASFFAEACINLQSLLITVPPTSLPLPFSPQTRFVLATPLFSLLSGYNGFPVIYFLRPISWPDKLRCSTLLHSPIVSSLASRIHSSVFGLEAHCPVKSI